MRILARLGCLFLLSGVCGFAAELQIHALHTEEDILIDGNLEEPVWSLMAAFSESIGGLLIATGFLFRPVSALLCFTMVMASVSHYASGRGNPECERESERKIPNVRKTQNYNLRSHGYETKKSNRFRSEITQPF